MELLIRMITGCSWGEFSRTLYLSSWRPVDQLLKHLERDSEWLQQQLGQYAPISGDFATKFAYEEYATLTVLGHSIMVREFYGHY